MHKRRGAMANFSLVQDSSSQPTYNIMFKKVVVSAVVAASLFAGSASAICPGYNFGITQTGSNTNPDYGVCEYPTF